MCVCVLFVIPFQTYSIIFAGRKTENTNNETQTNVKWFIVNAKDVKESDNLVSMVVLIGVWVCLCVCECVVLYFYMFGLFHILHSVTLQFCGAMSVCVLLDLRVI